MTRSCKWCDTPLSGGAHGSRKYCVGGCRGEPKYSRQRAYRREYMREYGRKYRQRPEVKEKRRVYCRRPEVVKKSLEYGRKYRQRPEVKKRKREYSKRQTQLYEANAAKRANEELLAILLEMEFSDEAMNEFGFERVES
jgi:hypothetical protein